MPHRRGEEAGAEGPRGPPEPLARAAVVAGHRPGEAGAEVVDAPRPVAQGPPRIGQDAPAAEVRQPVGEAPRALAHRPDEPGPERGDLSRELGLLAHDQLGGGRRRRRPQVGHEVGDRDVGLVPDRGDDRDLRRGDRPGDAPPR